MPRRSSWIEEPVPAQHFADVQIRSDPEAICTRSSFAPTLKVQACSPVLTTLSRNCGCSFPAYVLLVGPSETTTSLASQASPARLGATGVTVTRAVTVT